MVPQDTAFFRDWNPFRHFKSVVLPNLQTARPKKHMCILSAGCSTGQEAYSMAMAIRDEARTLTGWKAEIVAVDLSEQVIDAAQQGTYSQFDIQRGLPIRHLMTYFSKEDDRWRISPGVSSMVTFKTWNLLEELYPLGKFDIVLCRNVLVYFDLQTKIDALQKIARVLTDDGVLYLGLEDAISGATKQFRPVVPETGVFAIERAGHPSSDSLAIKPV